MRRVLVANRGEIAVRVVRACFDEGLAAVVAVSDADRTSLAASLADDVVVIGPAAASDSYLSVERIVAAALHAGCDALHPGYGFLSERPELAEACEGHGIVFVGPPAAVMRRAGDKLEARRLAHELGIPTAAGSEALTGCDDAVAAAATMEYPLILKASAGGGGRGMRVVPDADALRAVFDTTGEEARRAFGDGRVYLERYVGRARHVEVQILADAHGRVCHLGERDCSTQRRHQKLIEEAPAPECPPPLVAAMRAAAVRLAEALCYVGAGTVEFLVDVEKEDFAFLELNARVQVEHPVTECVTGVDIVREQLRIASGAPLSFSQHQVHIDGHAIECRINAEDPSAGFAPSPGRVASFVMPQAAGVRVDSHVQPGTDISPHYDSLLAKLVVHAGDRDRAVGLMQRALARCRITGVATTIPLHQAILADPGFQASPPTTAWLEAEFLALWRPDMVVHDAH